MSLQDRSIAIIGAGNMGRALLKMALHNGARIFLFDINPEAFNNLPPEYSGFIASGRLNVNVIEEETFTTEIPPGINAIIIAVSWHDARELINVLASQIDCPIIVLGRPDLNDPLIPAMGNRKHPLLLGTGLEPGLMESMSSSILERFPQSHTIESFCGGIPVTPTGPFGYRLTFGRKLPIDPRLALTIKDHQTFSVPRFAQVKHHYFPSIGLLEAFDDAMLATTAEYFQKHVVNFSQNTLRWPGFSYAARACQELGLLSRQEINVGKLNTSIRDVAETLFTAACKNVETTSEDFVLCKWQHISSSGEKGELIIKVFQPAPDITAMAFMTCAFAITATEVIFEMALKNIIYPHENPAGLIGLKFLNEIKKFRHVEITTSGTLTCMITEAV
ncbi:saccharopine dehydrogenase C-terminal domain-containing protein [Rahnella perminowiae]|uniref:saccharopine dehydrogenase C-terminal domain-containing protein n=1 Tax=Rahnella perminowiae TaxID=2816244 RepID=UPI00224A637A|nr:saccharopine dehydrogenase C-terminal domain-containing protein [Rahnella perminowiae]MCX2944057.1 NAD(P)-binding domain-containing protein [Rahnella perminowiae]